MFVEVNRFIIFGIKFEILIIQLNNTDMNDLIKQYEKTKKKALQFMQKGQIAAYLQALKEMNTYKTMLLAIAAN